MSKSERNRNKIPNKIRTILLLKTENDFNIKKKEKKLKNLSDIFLNGLPLSETTKRYEQNTEITLNDYIEKGMPDVIDFQEINLSGNRSKKKNTTKLKDVRSLKRCLIDFNGISYMRHNSSIMNFSKKTKLMLERGEHIFDEAEDKSSENENNTDDSPKKENYVIRPQKYIVSQAKLKLSEMSFRENNIENNNIEINKDKINAFLCCIFHKKKEMKLNTLEEITNEMKNEENTNISVEEHIKIIRKYARRLKKALAKKLTTKAKDNNLNQQKEDESLDLSKYIKIKKKAKDQNNANNGIEESKKPKFRRSSYTSIHFAEKINGLVGLKSTGAESKTKNESNKRKDKFKSSNDFVKINLHFKNNNNKDKSNSSSLIDNNIYNINNEDKNNKEKSYDRVKITKINGIIGVKKKMTFNVVEKEKFKNLMNKDKSITEVSEIKEEDKINYDKISENADDHIIGVNNNNNSDDIKPFNSSSDGADDDINIIEMPKKTKIKKITTFTDLIVNKRENISKNKPKKQERSETKENFKKKNIDKIITHIHKNNKKKNTINVNNINNYHKDNNNIIHKEKVLDEGERAKTNKKLRPKKIKTFTIKEPKNGLIKEKIYTKEDDKNEDNNSFIEVQKRPVKKSSSLKKTMKKKHKTIVYLPKKSTYKKNNSSHKIKKTTYINSIGNQQKKSRNQKDNKLPPLGKTYLHKYNFDNKISDFLLG